MGFSLVKKKRKERRNPCAENVLLWVSPEGRRITMNVLLSDEKLSDRKNFWRRGKKGNTRIIHSFPSFFFLSIIFFITDLQCARHWAGQAGNSSKKSLWNPALVSIWKWKWKQLSHVRLCDPVDCSPWNSPGQHTGVGSLSLLQGIFPTQGLNPDLLHCRQILYPPSHKGSPRITRVTVQKQPGF